MNELFDWLARLEKWTENPPSQGAQRLNRVGAATPVRFDLGLVTSVDLGQELAVFPGLSVHLGLISRIEDADKAPSIEDGAIAAQLGAVLTLATNRRVRVGAGDLDITTGDKHHIIALPLSLDTSLDGPLDGSTETAFRDVLTSLNGLNEDARAPIGAAIELHYAATILTEAEPNAAYALVVGAIERLSSDFGEASGDWASWDKSTDFDQLFARIKLTDTQADALRTALLKDRFIRIQRKFIDYVKATLPESFWEQLLEEYAPAGSIEMAGSDPPQFYGFNLKQRRLISDFVPREPAALDRRLRDTYQARSTYVHAGKRLVGMRDAIAERVDGAGLRDKGPLDFAALRAILRTLLLTEIAARGTAKPLPGIFRAPPSGT